MMELFAWDIGTYSAFYGNSTYDAHWQRLLFLRDLLSGGTDASIIAYFDDDVLITNFSVRIENYFRLVANPEQIHLIVSRDAWVNEFKFLINTGTMLLRNSERSLSFINYMLKVHDEIPYIQRNPEWDQDAAIITILEFFYNQTLILPLCLLQSLWSFGAHWHQWQPGHFALHHLGSYSPDRYNTFAALTSNFTKWWEENRSRFNLHCMDETVIENMGKNTVPLYDIPSRE